MTSDQRSVLPDHWLFPHERCYVAFVLERQRTHQTPAILQMEQKYGSEGTDLIMAGLATASPAGLIACLGIILLLVSRDHGLLLSVGYLLLGLAILLCVLGSLRYIQAFQAGRRFRGDYPFVKHP